MPKVCKNISLTQSLYDSLKELQELNDVKSFSELIEYHLQNSFNPINEINRLNIDKCHAELEECLSVIRRMGKLLNAIVKMCHQEKGSIQNYKRIEKFLIKNDETMKEAIAHLVLIEEFLNIENRFE